MLKGEASGSVSKKSQSKYNDYTPGERARTGKYIAKNRPARAVHHFLKVMGKKVPETIARRLKSKYLCEMKVIAKTTEMKTTTQFLRC